MDPEEIEAQVAPLGFPVVHYDGYSVVRTPSGDEQIAHRTRGPRPPVARVPAPPAAAPPVVGVPPMLARPLEPPTVVPPSLTPPMQRSRDAMRQAQADARVAAIADENARELARLRAEAGYEVSEPDQFGIMTRTYPDGRTERVSDDPAAFDRERSAVDSTRARLQAEGDLTRARATATHAGTRTFPDGTQVTTDAQGHIVPPALDMDRLRAEMAGGGRVAVREDEVPTLTERVSGAADAVRETPRTVADATGWPVVGAAADALDEALPPSDGVPPMLARPPDAPAEGVPPMLARPTGPAPTPRAPRPAGVPGGMGGAHAPAPAPMTLPQAIETVAGTPGARGAFDQTIAGLARDPRDGGHLDSIDRQALLEQQRAGLAEKAAQTQAGIEARVEQQRQEREAERTQAMQGARQRYQNAVDRVASMRLDPSHFFRDGGNAVGSVIAVALGAFGQAFSGSSTNDALSLVNQAIERDLDAQRSEIDTARAGADLQGNMIGIMRDEFGDREAADSAAHAAMLQQAALHVQEMEAGLAGQEALNNAEALRAQLEAAAQEAQAAAEDRQVQNDLRRAQTLRELARADAEARRAARIGMGGPRRVTPQMYDVFDRAMAGGATQAAAEQMAGFAPGTGPQHSPMTTEQRGVLDALSSSLDHLEGVAGEGDIPGIGLWDSRLPGPEGRLVRDELANAIDLLGRLRSGGAISEDEEERFATILGASEDQTEEQFRAGLQRVRRELGSRLSRGAQDADAVSREHADVGFTPG